MDYVETYIVEFYRDEDAVRVPKQIEMGGGKLIAILKVPSYLYGTWKVNGNHYIAVYQNTKELAIEVLT